MPIELKEDLMPGIRLAVWKITESEHFFDRRLRLSPQGLSEKEKISHPSKRLQFMASRLLMQELLSENHSKRVLKTGFGKLVVPGSEVHISISHSGIYAAAAISDRNLGIDIQVPDARLLHLSKKFIGSAEAENLQKEKNLSPLDFYHLVWGAKESMFKAYEKGGLDFIGHLKVQPFEAKKTGDWGETTASLQKSEERKRYSIHFNRGRHFYLVVASE